MDGVIGETEGLVCELQNEKGEVIKKDINIGANYVLGTRKNFGDDLPAFSFDDGLIKEVKKGTSYRVNFNVEYMNLGLDLVGGSELVYQLPTPKVVENVNTTSSDNVEVSSGGNNERSDVDINGVISIVGKKLNNNGLKEIFIQRAGEKRMLIQLPGLKKSEVQKIKKAIETQGQLEISVVVDDENIIAKARKYLDRGIERGLAVGLTKKEAIAQALPLPNFRYKFLFKHRLDNKGKAIPVEGTELLVKADTKVTGKHIVRASKELDTQGLEGGFAVNITFNSYGSTHFGRLTQENVRKRMAIALDADLISAPVVNEPILTGQCRITGGFDEAGAQNLVTVLRSGSMDVKLDLISENTVGPTLGADSINSGIMATLIGGSLVLLFMLFYYRVLGFIACVALSLNMLLLFASMIFGKATLTLPGIAGFALTIGMAVDATVLIYERLREESLNEKQNIKASLTKGYDRAFITIFDSNFTTFITALILYLVGNSAPVKGFCFTLMLGLIINLFAAVFVTQTLIAWAVANQKIKAFNMAGNISTRTVDFFAIGKKVRLISYLILIGGCALMFSRGATILDVDFLGGNLLHVQLEEPAKIDDVRKVCEKAGYKGAVVQQFGDYGDTYYTIRTKHLNEEQKKVFHAFLQEGQSIIKLPKNIDLAFPMESTVGGVAAKEMLAYALIALIAAMLVILLYIMMRFTEFKYGFGACLALIHDIGITISILIIFKFQINLTIFAAILTVIGYSLNDTIVIFDRIRENIGSQKNFDFKAIAIKSLNQTMKRTILTSITTLFVILSLVFAGGGIIKGFAITMLVGLISGTYSSLFIATPYVLYLYNKEKNLGNSNDEQKMEPVTPTT